MKLAISIAKHGWSTLLCCSHMAARFAGLMLTPAEATAEVDAPDGGKSTLEDQVRETWTEQYDDWFCCRNARISAAHVGPA